MRQPRHIHFVRHGKIYDFMQGYRKSVQLSRTFDGVAATLEFSMTTYQKAVTSQE